MADVELDSAGIAEVLRSGPVAGAVHDLAATIAEKIRGQRQDADVVVDDYTTDRAASSVTIRDPRALGWQARDGILTKAAASTGLDVRAR